MTRVRLVRAVNGDTIHRRGCTAAGATMTFRIGETRPDWIFAFPHLRPCKRCLPELAAEQENAARR